MIDPKDIKAGAQFVVTIAPVHYGDRDYAPIANLENELEHTSVPTAYLSPLPTPSPTAEIDAEIVEAAERWRASNRRASPTQSPTDGLGLLQRLTDLVDQRVALLKPKDAVGELLEAVRAAEKTDQTQAFWQHRGLIAAITEAAARVRKERGE